MQITIQESTISNLDKIQELSLNKRLFFSNFVDIKSTETLINSYIELVNCRPRLKKIGIYVEITIENIEMAWNEALCREVLQEYVNGIGWDDLQYVSFFELNSSQELKFHIVFNRVTPEGGVINLRCVGATPRQYQILQKALDIIQFLQTKEKISKGLTQKSSLSITRTFIKKEFRSQKSESSMNSVRLGDK